MDDNTRHRSRLPIRARVATTVGGAAATVSRLAGKGDGSVIGGVISLRLAPDLLSLLAAGRRVVLVTGTNGKTTTTKLITAALAPLGGQIASNIYGANMEAGLTSALTRAPDARVAVLETDEKYIPAMVRATSPKVVVLLNLSRDQMDRAAEIWLLARRWREALAAAPDCRVVANADDPLVAWAAGSARQVTWVAAGQRWREDSWCCPNCGAHLQRDRYDGGAIGRAPGGRVLQSWPADMDQTDGQRQDWSTRPGGRPPEGQQREGDDWSCGECGQRRPPVSWMLYDNEVIDPKGRATRLDLALPGRANRSNAVIALAVADAFGVHTGQALRELRQVTSVAGRYTQVSRRGCDVRLLLAKNPAGWLEALDVIAPPPAPVLLSVNAQGPDGRDTSWLWDVDFRRLRGRTVLVGGERKLDLAVRLEADEVAFKLVDDIDEAIDAARAVAPNLEVLANYTAFQQYRVALGRVQ
jgi:lipid II isoglutaminyl synthase (glutamine-hydrolysing)